MENVNPYDIIVIAILVLAAFWGGMRGVIAQLASIASWVISWIAAMRFSSITERFIPFSESSKSVAAPVVTFLICVVAITIGARFLKQMVSLAGLKEFDRQMGALLGVIKGGVLCLLITFFAVVVGGKAKDFVNNSKSGPFFVSVIMHVEKYFPQSSIKEKFSDLFEANKEELSEKNSIENQVDELKSYLTQRVLSGAASQIVKDADEVEKNGEQASTSQFSSFVSGLRNLTNKVKGAVKEETATVDGSQKTTTKSSDSSFGINMQNQYDYEGGYSPNRTSSYSSYSGDYTYGSEQWTNGGSREVNEDTNWNQSSAQASSYNSNRSYESESDVYYAPDYFYRSNGGYGVGAQNVGQSIAPNSYDANYAEISVNDLTNDGNEFGFRVQTQPARTYGRNVNTSRQRSRRTESSARLRSRSYSSPSDSSY